MVRNGKMCKDKWNNLNFEYKKKIITRVLATTILLGNSWIINEHDKHHLLKQYKVIETF
jgi:hypothetical protein